MQVVQTGNGDEDPFTDLDDVEIESTDSCNEDLRELVSCLKLKDGGCSVEEFFAADNDLQVHVDDKWEQNFQAEIGPRSRKSPHLESTAENLLADTEDKKEYDPLLLEQKIRNFSEALSCLLDISQFLDYKGHTTEVTQVMSMMSAVASIHRADSCKKMKQIAITDFC